MEFCFICEWWAYCGGEGGRLMGLVEGDTRNVKIWNHLSALKQFDFNNFVKFYIFSRMLGLKKCCSWSHAVIIQINMLSTITMHICGESSVQWLTSMRSIDRNGESLYSIASICDPTMVPWGTSVIPLFSPRGTRARMTYLLLTRLSDGILVLFPRVGRRSHPHLM